MIKKKLQLFILITHFSCYLRIVDINLVNYYCTLLVTQPIKSCFDCCNCEVMKLYFEKTISQFLI